MLWHYAAQIQIGEQYQVVWDGKFDLTIEISVDRMINESSLLFETCWQESEAFHAMENPSVYDYGFRTARISATGQFSVDVLVLDATMRTG